MKMQFENNKNNSPRTTFFGKELFCDYCKNNFDYQETQREQR